MTGHITVTTAGTPVQEDAKGSRWYITPHPDNTDTVWIKSTAASDGFPLKSGEVAGIMLSSKLNLNEWFFDAEVSGEKLCYMIAP